MTMAAVEMVQLATAPTNHRIAGTTLEGTIAAATITAKPARV